MKVIPAKVVSFFLYVSLDLEIKVLAIAGIWVLQTTLNQRSFPSTDQLHGSSTTNVNGLLFKRLMKSQLPLYPFLSSLHKFTCYRSFEIRDSEPCVVDVLSFLLNATYVIEIDLDEAFMRFCPIHLTAIPPIKRCAIDLKTDCLLWNRAPISQKLLRMGDNRLQQGTRQV